MRCLLLLDEEERLDKDGLLVEVALSADMVAVHRQCNSLNENPTQPLCILGDIRETYPSMG